SEPPVASARPVRDGLAEVRAGDLVLLWGGGLYPWFDPLTPIRAVAALRDREPRVHLVVHAGAHPNAAVRRSRVAAPARALAGELGVLGRRVHLNETWVPYAQRADWLLDADAGVTMHTLHVETDYAFRTRVLDYLWAELPVLCSRGDTLAAEVE